MTETPAKYQAKPRDYEDKSWLYEKYWGEKLSKQEVADEAGTCKQVILANMKEHGIPRRANTYGKNNTVSPFTGFYRDEAARTDEESNTVDKTLDSGVDDKDLQWQKLARRDDSISDEAIL